MGTISAAQWAGLGLVFVFGTVLVALEVRYRSAPPCPLAASTGVASSLRPAPNANERNASNALPSALAVLHTTPPAAAGSGSPTTLQPTTLAVLPTTLAALPTTQPPAPATPQLMMVSGADALGSYKLRGTESWMRDPWKSALVDMDHKLVFCSIPKNGCTPWRRLFARLTGKTFWQSPYPAIHYAMAAKGDHLSSFKSNLTVAERILRDPKFIKFAVVRHPHSRILSAYLDKIVKENYSKSHFQMQGQMTFAEFVHRLVEQRACLDPPDEPHRGIMNEHWQPQLCFCGLTELKFQYVHFEDVPRLMDQLAAAGLIPGSILVDGYGTSRRDSFFGFNSTSPESHAANAAHADELVSRYYTADLLQAIRKRFAADFEAFGFNPFKYDKAVALARQAKDPA